MSNVNPINIKDLILSYGKHTVLEITELNVLKEALIAVVGRNGSGKSTLLRCLVNLQSPKSGSISVFNKPILKLNPSERAKLISFVGPHPVNVPQLSVFDLIAGGRYPHTSALHRLSKADIFQIEHSIDLLSLAKLKKRLINELSDGERQKCMIARACAQDTPIMVLDEPTAFLDYPSRRELLNNLKTLVEVEKKCVIFSSHDLELALPKSDHCWFLENKELIEGRVEDVKSHPVFKSFINGND